MESALGKRKMTKLYKYAEQPSAILEGLDELRAEGSLCDAVLRASDGQTFPVHRNVLAAASPYFRAMFVSGFKEANNTDKTPIELPSISSKGLRNVLDCLYLGQLELTNEHVYDIFPVAHMLQLTSIIASCVEWLIQEMSGETCFKNLRIAEEYELLEVVEAAEDFITDNFVTVSATDEFRELTLEQVCFYLEKNTLKGKEIEIYRAAKKWFEHKPDRKQHLSKVLSCIRFEGIPIVQITDEVMCDKVLVSDEKVFSMMRSALKSNSNMYGKALNTAGRCCRGEERLILITEGPIKDNDGYVPKSQAIEKCFKKSDFVGTSSKEIKLTCRITALESKLAYASVNFVNVNDFAYLFAVDGETFTPITKRLDGSSGEWMDLAPIPRQATVGSTATRVGDVVVVVGGKFVKKDSQDNLQDPHELTDATFCYDIAKNRWIRRNSCPSRVTFHAACSRENYVYIAGGNVSSEDDEDENDVELSDKLYAYDVKANLWLTKADMNHDRAEAVLEAIDDKLFLLGGGNNYQGSENVPSIEMYDILQNQWTIIEESPGFPYDSAGSFVDGTSIYLLGGYNYEQNEKSDCISVFDSKTKKIKTLKQKLDKGAHGFGCIVMKLQNGL